MFEICLRSQWREGLILLQAVYLRFYVIAYFISLDIYIKSFRASFELHLSHIQDVLKVIAIGIAMIFVEIQKIFE